MKVTVCELPNDHDALEIAWNDLIEHVQKKQSDLVLLPEMPFYRWLAHTDQVEAQQWQRSVDAHKSWMDKLNQLSVDTVISTRPTLDQNTRQNMGYVWHSDSGVHDAHAKYYLPNEPGYWEASWYQRGNQSFEAYERQELSIGFLICTELWFNQHARKYGQSGTNLLVCPRATPQSTAPKWVAGGQTAAVVSGAFCLSSNLSGQNQQGSHFAGTGWIIEPEEGQILGLTSSEQPFLTLDIDLEQAANAKNSYPRDVLD